MSRSLCSAERRSNGLYVNTLHDVTEQHLVAWRSTGDGWDILLWSMRLHWLVLWRPVLRGHDFLTL